MAQSSNIEWTEATWNPIAGCTAVSPGCLNCYAATMSNRLAAMGQAKYVGLTVKRHGRHMFNGKLSFDETALSIPLKRKKPTVWFVNSMGDLFHEDVPFEFINKVFAAMALCPQHTFQVLTKRPERMVEYFLPPSSRRSRQERVSEACGDTFNYRDLDNDPVPHWPLRNVWLGASVENQEQADKRIPHLLNVPAVVRFLSVEPMLGPLEFSDVTRRSDVLKVLGQRALSGIHWVIVGGESGPGARPMRIEWARSILRQCQAASVACFVKQLGSNPQMGILHVAAGNPAFRIKDRKGGEMSEWPEDLRIREMPKAVTA